MKTSFCRFLMIAAVLQAAPALGPSHAYAIGRYVATNGNDSNPGTVSQPWRTIARSTSGLNPGDTLYVRGGTYFEEATVSTRGSTASPIVIRSYPGETATLDSGVPEFRTPGNSDWELVNGALGEYRSTRTYSQGGYIYAYVDGISGYMNQRVFMVPYQSSAPFRSLSELYVDSSTPFYIGPGTYWDSSDSRYHIRMAKTSDLVATELRYGTIFSSATPDPRSYSIFLSDAYATLTVTGSYLVFKDLVINQAQNSVHLTSGAHDLTFDGVTVWCGDRTVDMDGVYNIVLKNSRFYGDAPYWVFWSDMKDSPAPGDLMRATNVNMHAGTHDVEISRCHIRGSGQDLVGTVDNEYNISVHHCRLENGGDDAFELEGTTDVGRISIYENYILNTLTAVSPGQDTPKYSGPLFFYRNVVALLRDPPINRKVGINSWNGGGRYGFEYMFKQETGSDYSTTNASYYQNTLVMLNHGGKGINWICKDPTNSRIMNNLAVMISGLVSRDYHGATGEVVDGNLYWKVNTVDTAPLVSSYSTVPAFFSSTGWEQHGIGTMPQRGTDPKFAGLQFDVVDRTLSRWQLRPASETPAMTDFFLSSVSPARSAAVAIPTHPTYGAMPDTRPEVDIGAIPYSALQSDYKGFPFEPTQGVINNDSIPPAAVVNLRSP
jgi:hypothetical protein